MRRWRGLKSLIHDAVDRTTELIEEGHESTSRSVMRVLGAIDPIAEPARALDGVRRFTTKGILSSVRIVNRAIEAVTDVGLDVAEHAVAPSPESAVPMRSDVIGTAHWIGDAALGLVNGAIGDHLSSRNNGLDLGLTFRTGGAYLALDRESLEERLHPAPRKIAVFLHGLGTTEWSWCLESQAYHGDPAASFGTLLERDLGYAPIYLRYNTGRHVSENGRLFAREMQRLLEMYPVDLEEILLVGHSMGGLVLRSGCHYAEQDGLAWTSKVRRAFCLGSPHHGAPLERIGHIAVAVLASIDTPGTRIPARLLEGRSAGIKDLRHGALVDEDWLGRDPDALRADPETRAIPLLSHVSYHFVSATVTMDRDHPVGRIVGDLLVQHPSASGARVAHESFPIETSHFGGVLHHQLQNHPSVYEQLRRACASD